MNPYAIPSLPFRETAYAHALCREFNPEFFFADPTNRTWIEKAKLICSFCPHTDQCRSDARERGELYGVFGGEDADERRKFMRTGKEEPYSPVRDLRGLGLTVNQIAERLGLQHDSVTANLRRNEARK